MIWAVVGLLAFCVMLALAAASAASRAADHEAAAREYRSLYRAARWLSTWNYASAAAMRDLCAKRLNISYAAIQALLASQLEKRPYYGCTVQAPPLDQVPASLRDEMEAYARRTLTDDSSEFHVVRRDWDPPEEQRLRDAVFLLTRAEPETVLVDIAESTGVPLPHVSAVAQALRSRAEYDLQRITGQDPEDILPSIY